MEEQSAERVAEAVDAVAAGCGLAPILRAVVPYTYSPADPIQPPKGRPKRRRHLPLHSGRRRPEHKDRGR